MIKFYLGEEPLLNNVKTYLCRNKRHKSYVLKNLNKLVVKEVHGAGGVGMLVGPLATKNEISRYKGRIETSPEKFIQVDSLPKKESGKIDKQLLKKKLT